MANTFPPPQVKEYKYFYTSHAFLHMSKITFKAKILFQQVFVLSLATVFVPRDKDHWTWARNPTAVVKKSSQNLSNLLLNSIKNGN
jgi:hypothetical protein